MNSNVHGRPCSASLPCGLQCPCRSPARLLAVLKCRTEFPCPLHSLPLHSPSPSLLCLSLPAPWPSGQDAAAADVLSLSSSFLQLQPPSPPHPLCLTAVAPSPRAAGAAGSTATSKVAAAAAGAHGQEAVVRCWPGRDLARVRPDVAKRQHGFPVLRRRSTIAEEPPTTVTDEPQCLLCFLIPSGTVY